MLAAQERLRWRWPQSLHSVLPVSSTGAAGDVVARELLGFLDSHLLAHDTDTFSGVLADQRPRGYSVEMYDPSLAGKISCCTESVWRRHASLSKHSDSWTNSHQMRPCEEEMSGVLSDTRKPVRCPLHRNEHGRPTQSPHVLAKPCLFLVPNSQDGPRCHSQHPREASRRTAGSASKSTRKSAARATTLHLPLGRPSKRAVERSPSLTRRKCWRSRGDGLAMICWGSGLEGTRD